MSNRIKRQRRNAAEDAATKRLMRCPDCPATVRIERDRYGDRTAFIEHAPTCPRVPAENRARQETTFMICDPQLMNISALKGEDDGQAE